MAYKLRRRRYRQMNRVANAKATTVKRIREICESSNLDRGLMTGGLAYQIVDPIMASEQIPVGTYFIEAVTANSDGIIISTVILHTIENEMYDVALIVGDDGNLTRAVLTDARDNEEYSASTVRSSIDSYLLDADEKW